MIHASPEWVYKLWCLGASDKICARDNDIPVSRNRRMFWWMRGRILKALFSWWWWETPT